ncbi:MAG: SCO family protein [Verrucomicrobiales bacterium]
MKTETTPTDRRSLFKLALAAPLLALTGATHSEAEVTEENQRGFYPAGEKDHHDTSLGAGAVRSFIEWPEFSLTNQDGKRVDFHRDIIVGRSVVLSYFYTHCDGSCPGTTQRMAELCELVGTLGVPVRFVSVSLKPHEDTPSELRAYARDVVPKGGDWHFLTGSYEEVTTLRHHLGFYELNPDIDRIPSRHSAMVLIGDDTTHRWLPLPAVAPLRQWRSVLARCRS